MQKNDIPCIKTGDFAKLCGTNKRTLIHYDEIGIFHPAYTDEKKATATTVKVNLIFSLRSPG